LAFRLAAPEDAPAVVALVNAAYRDDTGQAWTTEVALIAGPRIDEAGFLALLRPGSVVLVAERAGALIGCVHLAQGEAGACRLGLLSVEVGAQGMGTGRALLAAAEAYARERFAATRMVMRVVSARHELLAWYERRGYTRTGRLEPFEPGRGERFIRGPLAFERLEKRLD